MFVELEKCLYILHMVNDSVYMNLYVSILTLGMIDAFFMNLNVFILRFRSCFRSCNVASKFNMMGCFCSHI